MNEHDYEIYLSTLKEIEENKDTPYMMANRELSVKFFNELKAKYPHAKMIEFSINQWFIITQKAQDKMKKVLERERIDYLTEVHKLENLINILDSPI